MRLFMVASLALALAFGSERARAADGRTKIQFQFDGANPTSSRLVARIDVSAAIGPLLSSGGSHDEDLKLQTITLTIGSAKFVAYTDIFGRTVEDVSSDPPQPFSSKLSASGKILFITATGYNLQDLLPVGTAQSGSFSIDIDVSVTNTFPGDNPPTTISLSQQHITFNYALKGTKVMGKSI
ncbi:MAG TPA: hypothetical protein VKX17_28060 [Planctomycetota bacterium]|nr:hypothetical protein [Planctomycetota bacterium]